MSHPSYPTSKDENTSEDKRLPPIRDLFRALEESRQMSPSLSQNYIPSSRTQQTVSLPSLARHGQTGMAYYDFSSGMRARSSSLTTPQMSYPELDSRHGGSSSHQRGGARNLPAVAQPRSSSVHNVPQDFDPEKRYKCEYCPKRFDRPSSLQVHIRTHTGVQPYTCEWPGCARTFNVKSNMLRHWRSHERSDLGPNGQDLGSFSSSEPHQVDQRSAWIPTGQESSSSGGHHSPPPTGDTGY